MSSRSAILQTKFRFYKLFTSNKKILLKKKEKKNLAEKSNK